MNRRETVFIKRSSILRQAQHSEQSEKDLEPVNPPHWLEMLGLIAVSLIMGIAVALNVPEAPSEGGICGVDRDAPTLDEGCKP